MLARLVFRDFTTLVQRGAAPVSLPPQRALLVRVSRFLLLISLNIQWRLDCRMESEHVPLGPTLAYRNSLFIPLLQIHRGSLKLFGHDTKTIYRLPFDEFGSRPWGGNCLLKGKWLQSSGQDPVRYFLRLPLGLCSSQRGLSTIPNSGGRENSLFLPTQTYPPRRCIHGDRVARAVAGKLGRFPR